MTMEIDSSIVGGKWKMFDEFEVKVISGSNDLSVDMVVTFYINKKYPPLFQGGGFVSKYKNFY
jgi:hypothetical protein